MPLTGVARRGESFVRLIDAALDIAGADGSRDQRGAPGGVGTTRCQGVAHWVT